MEDDPCRGALALAGALPVITKLQSEFDLGTDDQSAESGCIDRRG